jgi:hypothetical protein
MHAEYIILLISDEFKRPESLYFEIVFRSLLLLTHPTVDNEDPKRRTELIKYRVQVTQRYPESSYIRRAMAQAVSLRPLTLEVQVLAPVSACGICGGQSGTGTTFTPSASVSPADIIPPWLSKLIYHPG